MNHNPELLAAAYLDGLPSRDRARYEEHLLTCEACWQEVALARRGRALAESVRDLAPAGIREDVRAAIAAAAAEQDAPSAAAHRRRRLAGSLAAAGILVAAVAVGGVLAWGPQHHQTAPIAAAPASTAPHSSGSQPTAPSIAAESTVTAAIAGFREDQLPGTAIAAQHAPDLTRLGLRLVATSLGEVDGTQLTAFAYRSNAGARLNVYRSTQPIPEAGEAHDVEGGGDAWRSDEGGVTVICGPANHTVLLIGSDPHLVAHAGRLLAIV